MENFIFGAVRSLEQRITLPKISLHFLFKKIFFTEHIDCLWIFFLDTIYSMKVLFWIIY